MEGGTEGAKKEWKRSERKEKGRGQGKGMGKEGREEKEGDGRRGEGREGSVGEGREGKGESGVWVDSQDLPTCTDLAKGTMEFKGRLRGLLRKH